FSLFVGVILGWIMVLPALAIHFNEPHTTDAYDAAMDLWSNHLRFVGVGTMLVGGFFTLAQLIRPIIKGFTRSWEAMGKARNSTDGVLRTEKDLPTPYVLVGLGLLTLAL